MTRYIISFPTTSSTHTQSGGWKTLTLPIIQVTRRENQRWTLDLKELSPDQAFTDPKTAVEKPQDKPAPDPFSRLKAGGNYSLVNVQTGDDLVVWMKDPKVSMWTSPDRSKPSAAVSTYHSYIDIRDFH